MPWLQLLRTYGHMLRMEHKSSNRENARDIAETLLQLYTVIRMLVIYDRNAFVMEAMKRRSTWMIMTSHDQVHVLHDTVYLPLRTAAEAETQVDVLPETIAATTTTTKNTKPMERYTFEEALECVIEFFTGQAVALEVVSRS